MKLYLLRHGQPDLASGLCYGGSDVPVLAEEHAQVVHALVSRLPGQIPMYTSPLSRCSELAAALSVALHPTKLVQDPRLTEMHFGKWEMRAWSDIPREEVDAWAADLVGYRPGGGESVLEAAQRIKFFYDDLRTSKTEAAIVVCHAGTIRLLMQCRDYDVPLEIASAAAGMAHGIQYGELVIVDYLAMQNQN